MIANGTADGMQTASATHLPASADVEPSHVITAMHHEYRDPSSIRIHLGRAKGKDQIDKADQRIAKVVKQFRTYAVEIGKCSSRTTNAVLCELGGIDYCRFQAVGGDFSSSA